MDDVTIRLARTKADRDAVFRIRRIVFVKEQHVSPKMEFEGLDAGATHIIVLHGSKPIGCARIRFLGVKAKLERIALLKAYREKGIGTRLVNYLLRYCRRKNARHAVMHAQTHAMKFYQRHGFSTAGKPFNEAGIRHIQMHKQL